MTISYLYVGVLDCNKVNCKKVVSRGWCKESTNVTSTISNFNQFSTPRSPLSLSRLAQMKLQDMVDEGKMSTGTVPQNFRNKNQTMPQIEISINGILKLLYNLKPGKAAGQDKIRPLILKELRVELAPIIKVIFERSLEAGKLPTD